MPAPSDFKLDDDVVEPQAGLPADFQEDKTKWQKFTETFKSLATPEIGAITALQTLGDSALAAGQEVVDNPAVLKDIPLDIYTGMASGTARWTNKVLSEIKGVGARLASIEESTLSESDRKLLQEQRAIPKSPEVEALDIQKLVPTISEPKTLSGKFVRSLTEAGLGIGELLTINKLMPPGMSHGNSIAASMGTMAMAESFAGGEDLPGIAKATISGALLGKVFEGTQLLPKMLSLPTNAAIFGGMTAQGLIAIRGGSDKLLPEDREQILIDTLIGWMLAMGGENRPWRDVTDTFKHYGFRKDTVEKAKAEVENIVGAQGLQEMAAKVLKEQPEVEQTPYGQQLRLMLKGLDEYYGPRLPREGEATATATPQVTEKQPGQPGLFSWAIAQQVTPERGWRDTLAKSREEVDVLASDPAERQKMVDFLDNYSAFMEQRFPAEGTDRRDGSVTGIDGIVRSKDYTGPDRRSKATLRRAEDGRDVLERAAELVRVAEENAAKLAESDRAKRKAEVAKVKEEKGVLPKAEEAVVPVTVEPKKDAPKKQSYKERLAEKRAKKTESEGIDTEGEQTVETFSQIVSPKKSTDVVAPREKSAVEKSREETTPEVKRTFFEPKAPVEKPGVDVSNETLASLDKRQADLMVRLTDLTKKLNGTKTEEEFNTAYTDINMAEVELQLVNKQIKQLRAMDIKKNSPELTQAQIDEIDRAAGLSPAAEAEKGDMIFETDINERVSESIKTGDIKRLSKTPADVLYDATPSVRIIKSEKVLKGDDFGDLMGEAITDPNTAGGVELGWTLKDGTFVPNWIMKKQAIKDMHVSAQVRMSYLLRLLSGEAGGGFGKKSREQMSPEALKYLIELKSVYKDIMKKANQEGKDIDTYLQGYGLSPEGIDHFKKVILMEIETRTAVPKATGKQRKFLKGLADSLGVDMDSYMQSAGIRKKLNDKELTFDDAMQVQRLLDSELSRRKGLDSVMEFSEEQIRNMIEMDNAPSASMVEAMAIIRPDLYQKMKSGLIHTKDAIQEFADSPQFVFARTPEGNKFYQNFDRADVLGRKDVEYVMGEHGLNLGSVEGILKPYSESSRNVGKALENKISPELLSPKEREAYTKLRGFFDWALNKFVGSRVPDAHRRSVIEGLADKVKYKVGENGAEIDAALRQFKREYSLTKGEMEALDLLRMKIEHYMPHVFDKKFLSDHIKEQIIKMESAKVKDTVKIEEFKDALVKLESGQIYTMSSLPKSVTFQYFKERHGMAGYKVDAGIAFNTYLRGWIRKMHDEPALQNGVKLWKALPPELRDYGKEFIKNYMGWNGQHKMSDAIKSFEWFRALGFSGRSAITNTTQIINTFSEAPIAAIQGMVRMNRGIIDAGAAGLTHAITTGHIIEGYRRATSFAGNKEFRETGLQREIPYVMYAGEFALLPGLKEKSMKVAGAMFNAVEYGLRAHAYHTGKVLAERKGLTGDDAFWYAVDFVHKTQFRYGRVGMPSAMRGPLGAVTQFSSYFIKQAELMHSWVSPLAKNPKDWTTEDAAGARKMFMYLALAYGGKATAKERMGGDIGNAMGIGVSVSDGLDMVSAMSKSDWEEASKKWQLMYSSEGTGILPTQFPLLSGPILDSITALRKSQNFPDKLKAVIATLEPVQMVRMRDFFTALKYGKPEKDQYPIYRYPSGELLTEDRKALKYKLSLQDLISRTFLAKPYAETDAQNKRMNTKLAMEQREKIVQGFVTAIENGNSYEVNRLVKLYTPIVSGIDVSSIESNRILKMNLTDEERYQVTAPPELRYLRDIKGKKSTGQKAPMDFVPD